MIRSWTRAALAVAMAMTSAGVACSVKAPEQAAAKPRPVVGTWGFDLTGMDKNVKPGDDFFRYSVGAWVDRTEIPADLPVMQTLTALGLKAEQDVRDTVEKAAAGKPAKGTIEQQVADAYFSYLDTARINELGMKPFEEDLAYLAGLKTHEDLGTAIGRPGMAGNTPIAVGPTQDAKNPDRYTLIVVQAGLSLPRDVYISDNPAFAQVRAKYRDYIEKMLTLAKVPGAAAAATGILALETKIAQAHWPIEKARNKDLTYNPKSLAELEAYAPDFPWKVTLASAGLDGQDRFVVHEVDAIAALAKLFKATPVATWRAYMTFHYLHAQADIMPAAFDEANFEFTGKVLGGVQAQRDRWKRAVGEINGDYAAGPLGEAVGRLYVKDHFTPEAKAATRQIIDNLLAAYQKRIATLEWMSPETRKAAIRKAQNVKVKIGYPDKWKDYSALVIEPGDAYGNRKRLSIFETNRQVARLNGPVDRDEWSQGPQTVNAYYSAEMNEIAFPAAILQPPAFDASADPAINYGGIGAVIGHEMGHGYDDQGAKSDERGVLRNWWLPEDEQRFKALTTKLAAQYSSYSPIEGQRVKGDATSGENIGDLGGLSVAFEAYNLSLGGKPAPVIDGFTGPQRFFLAWGQVWRGKYRDEYLRQILASDVHSPVMYRVNGVVRNIDAWYEAFGVKPGDRLFLPPEERVRIW